jgi:hypothetical protein
VESDALIHLSGGGRAGLGDHDDMVDAELESFLADYHRMCADAGVEALADDEAREQARAMIALLVPAFEAEFRQHSRVRPTRGAAVAKRFR